MLSKRPLLTFLCLLALTSMACALPDFGVGADPNVTPTPIPTPTPQGDTISYLVPSYVQSLSPGESIPGTQLSYIGREENLFRVRINGNEVNKRIADSFFWDGLVAPGVYANYNLRVTTDVLGGGLPVIGPVELIVLNPQPEYMPTIPTERATLVYDNIAINYHVPAGYTIPGTSVTFLQTLERGEGDLKTTVAQLDAPAGFYPEPAFGDSFDWSGKLRENVYVTYNLRLDPDNNQAMLLIGTATLYVVEP